MATMARADRVLRSVNKSKNGASGGRSHGCDGAGVNAGNEGTNGSISPYGNFHLDYILGGFS